MRWCGSSWRFAATRPQRGVRRATGRCFSSAILQYVSFYKYVALTNLPRLQHDLHERWSALRATGRIYIAAEGINAQMTVPVDHYDAFARDLRDLRPAGPGLDVTPPPFADVFLNAGAVLDDPPFDKLRVVVRPHIVRDGLQQRFDMRQRGNEVEPGEWQARLANRSPDSSLLLDCRNFYEHEIGRFQGAERVMVDVFKDTFAEVDALVAGRHPQDTHVMIYCTGGIRCEKVGAYLHAKGFTNVDRLRGGIVHYLRYVQGRPGEPSLFQGKNFVFDARMQHAVTDDVLGACYQCKAPCDSYANCRNDMCHALMIQCPSCSTTYDGACCVECQDEKRALDAMPDEEARAHRKRHSRAWRHPNPNVIHRYKPFAVRGPRNAYARPCCTYATRMTTVPSSPALDALRKETARAMPRAHMSISEVQAAFLQFLIRAIGAKDVLELGCFTGYSALAMAEAGADVAVTTCDIDESCVRVATRCLPADARVRIELCRADDLLARLVADGSAFDLIFVDANKRQYRQYYDTIMSSALLRRSGVMVFDNVLFKGLVAQDSPPPGDGNNRIAAAIADFNAYVAGDPRSTQVLLPFADGMTLVRHASSLDT